MMFTHDYIPIYENMIDHTYHKIQEYVYRWEKKCLKQNMCCHVYLQQPITVTNLIDLDECKLEG